jgi:hypothetical protein
MGKKTKSKTKEVLFTKKGFSERFQSLYDNKKFSDVTLVYKNGEEQPSHLFILTQSSDYFQEKSSINIEETKETFQILLEFFYKGSVDCKDEKKFFKFLQLCFDYKAKYLEGMSVPVSMSLLNMVIDYTESDMNKNTDFFEFSLKLFNFKKLDEEKLKKVQKKKEWLKKNSTWKKKVKTAGGDGSDSDKSSNSDSDSDSDKSSNSDSEDSDKSSDSESSSEDEKEKLPEFNPKTSSTVFKFDKKAKTITKSSGDGW